MEEMMMTANSFSFPRAALAVLTALAAGSGSALADEGSGNSVQELFSQITSSYQAAIPDGRQKEIYDNFCPRQPAIQSMIDYYVLANGRGQHYIQDIPKHLHGKNDTSYVSNNADLPARSFPLLNWDYNSITWAGEPMKFYYLVANSWALGPIYNITPDRKAAPTGRLLMAMAVGASTDLLGVDTPLYQSDCKQDNYCNEDLEAFRPFRRILLITRDDDFCSAAVYRAERVDTEFVLDNPISRNEVRLFAPHGNFRFEIMQKDWIGTDGKTRGSFTYDLNTLTIDGVKYRMIPASGPWNKGTWYLKGDGPLHEKWLYMYPTGRMEDVYANSPQPKYHKADRVVVNLFESRSFAGGESVRRIVLRPVAGGKAEAGTLGGSGKKGRGR